MGLNLFADYDQPEGLSYVPLWLSNEDQAALLEDIASTHWSTDLERRVQHYGFRYSYRHSSLGAVGSAPPLTPLLTEIADRLHEEGFMKDRANQVIVNEYLVDGERTQGISAHRDHPTLFGPTVVTLSLLEAWSMRFTRLGCDPIEFLLDAGSIAVLSGDARYEWDHSIPPRRYERSSGIRVPRHRRISVTFRTVNS
jgi:alkylated DNA repair dioxygenase AlkB